LEAPPLPNPSRQTPTPVFCLRSADASRPRVPSGRGTGRPVQYLFAFLRRPSTLPRHRYMAADLRNLRTPIRSSCVFPLIPLLYLLSFHSFRVTAEPFSSTPKVRTSWPSYPWRGHLAIVWFQGHDRFAFLTRSLGPPPDHTWPTFPFTGLPSV